MNSPAGSVALPTPHVSLASESRLADSERGRRNRHPRFLHVKVLALTADTSAEALARSFGHGADDFVKKPFDRQELGIRAFRLLGTAGQ